MITVITTVLNDAQHIRDTIKSVLACLDTSLEYIIIDGGSTDGTVDVIKEYEHNLKYWVSEKDNGIYDAMNKGWSAARNSSYILFLGAGDRLLSLPENLDNCDADVVYGRVRMGKSIVCNSSIDFKLRFCNTLHHQALLVNKSVSQDPPFDSSLGVYADFDFNQRLYIQGATFVYSDSFWGYALPGGVSDKVDYAEYFKVISKNYGVLWGMLMFVFEPSLKIYKFIQKRVFRIT